ncbi:hypothetical protein E8D34_15880 [Nocardioides sp. GY 10113]|uniref:hypothetical protein n=1 Tax=Nocardioides sp. GY 10113 TaxID=2569761 RepID=UPI0010A8EC1B|nr:hypothetical protein [Nocardioides sp. GY 10113]TIC83601.1 hypothetical protein E8D34_15880 [Nocardioides sp. GY 10113]
MTTHLGRAGRDPTLEMAPVRLRAFLAGEPALDTGGAALVWEPRRIVPAYAVPERDLLVAVETSEPQPEATDPVAQPLMLTPPGGAETGAERPDGVSGRAGRRPPPSC